MVWGGAIAIVGAAGCALTASLWSAPKGLLESDPFMGFLAIAVLGLGLIVAAGARDALLSGESAFVQLTRFDVVDEKDERGTDRLTVHPVFRNIREGDVYRTRYEMALQAEADVNALLLHASAPSVLGMRLEDVRIRHQEAGHGAGKAWVSVVEPPFLFRLDVMTSRPEDDIRIGGSVR